MAISTEHAGRTYPPTDSYRVTGEKIAEFAAALGDDDPAYTGDAAIAPPTFAAVIAARAWQVLWDDAELELELARVVHADQRIDHVRALRVGDLVTAQLTIDKVRQRQAVDMISSSMRLHTATGEHVCTAGATFWHSREVA